MQRDVTPHPPEVNLWQGWLLLAVMGALLGLIGWTLAAGWGLLLALACMLAFTRMVPHITTAMLLRIYGARPLDPQQLPGLYEYIGVLAHRAGLERTPNLYLFQSDQPHALAMGHPDSAGIAISDALLRRISARELGGVLAHEIAHIAHDDLEIMGLADLFGRMTLLLCYAGQLLLLVSLPLWLLVEVEPPWQAILLLIAAPLLSTLSQLALSRTREYAADAKAAALTGDPQGLAYALRRLDALSSRMPWPAGRSPVGRNLFSGHPPTASRVAQLAGIAAADGMTWLDAEALPPLDSPDS